MTSATAINYGAFSGCRFITSISINSGVATIGALAFEGCVSLETPDGAVCRRAHKLRGRQGDDEVCVRHRVRKRNLERANPRDYLAVTIAENALLGMTGLVNLTLNNVTSIHRGAFSGCLNLENPTVPYIGARSVADGQEGLCWVTGSSR